MQTKGAILCLIYSMCSKKAFLTHGRISRSRWNMCTQSALPTKSRICIIGGGFGGLYTALDPTLTDHDITLIEPKDKFVFLPLLYELAVGTANILEVAPRYDDLVRKPNIRFIQGVVENIDLVSKSVIFSGIGIGRDNITYDQLVVAVGARPRLDIIPGAVDYALPFYTVEDAYKLRKYLRLYESNKDSSPLVRVVVIGGGYSGVEVATSIIETLGRDRCVVSIIERNEEIMKTSPSHNRLVAERAIRDYGISVNCNTIVDKVNQNNIQLTSQSGTSFDIQFDLCICTAGIQQSELVKSLELPKDPTGRLLTTNTLECVNNPSVFALGDCSAIDGYRVPSNAQAAIQQAKIVAANLAVRARQNIPAQPLSATLTQDVSDRPGADLTSRLEKFKYVALGEMLTLGASTDGSVAAFGELLKLDGVPAAAARRLAYAFRMPTPQSSVTALVGAGLSLTGSVLSKLLRKASD